jgi:hypothetical protein
MNLDNEFKLMLKENPRNTQQFSEGSEKSNIGKQTKSKNFV